MPRIIKKGLIKNIESKKEKPVEYQERIKCDVKNTLKECGGEGITYSEGQKKLMIWYNYFFLNRGKPSTHILALSQIDESILIKNMPSVICRLIGRAKTLI